MEGQSQVYNLIDTGMSSDIFTPIGCSLHCCLFLCIPVDGHHVQEMKNTHDGTTHDHIMKEVSINVMWQHYKLAKQLGSILWGKFLYITIDTMGPLILIDWNIGIIWFFSMYNSFGILYLEQVSTDMLNMIKMSTKRLGPETWHCHDGSTDVKMANRDSPLHVTDEWLIYLNLIVIEKLWIVNLWMITFLEQWKCLGGWLGTKKLLVGNDHLVNVLPGRYTEYSLHPHCGERSCQGGILWDLFPWAWNHGHLLTHQ